MAGTKFGRQTGGLSRIGSRLAGGHPGRECVRRRARDAYVDTGLCKDGWEMSEILWSSTEWARSEFGECQLGDRRRTERAVRYAQQVVEHPCSLSRDDSSWMMSSSNRNGIHLGWGVHSGLTEPWHATAYGTATPAQSIRPFLLPSGRALLRTSAMAQPLATQALRIRSSVSVRRV